MFRSPLIMGNPSACSDGNFRPRYADGVGWVSPGAQLAGGAVANVNAVGQLSGSPIILTGNNFGAKVASQPVHYQNFAGLAQDGTPASAGYLQLAGQITAGTGPAFVDRNDGLSGGCLVCRTGPGSTEAPGENFWHITNLMPNGTTMVYRSFWIKAVRTSGNATSYNQQVKSNRSGKMGAGGVQYYQAPIFKSSIYLDAATGNFLVLNRSYIRADGTTVQDGSLDSAPNPHWVANGWNFIEVAIRLNSIGQSDGAYWYKINGVLMLNESGFSMRTSAADTLDYDYLIPGFDAQPGTNWDIKFCNDYLDNSIGRVILTDSADFASSSIWQPQPWSSWVNGQIIISNPVWSGFTVGQQGHFHVFDNTTGAYNSEHARAAA